MQKKLLTMVIVSLVGTGFLLFAPKLSMSKTNAAEKSTSVSTPGTEQPKQTKQPTPSPDSTKWRSDFCETCARDAQGNIARSESAKQEFRNQNPLPAKCPTAKDCVIDHVKPLACGGADSPSNMQYQTLAEGKDKYKTERKGCR